METSSDLKGNTLLSLVPADVSKRLAPIFERVVFKDRRVLHHADAPIEHAYFLESGLVSVLANLGGGITMEAWLIGSEGMVGIPLIFGERMSSNRRIAIMPGSALRVSADKLLEALNEEPNFREVMLGYAHFILFQASQTGACNASHAFEQRLARWLLMADDRCKHSRMRLTHQVLSRMLGVRRATVTDSINCLEKEQLLRKSRSTIEILDREGLTAVSCNCYRAVNLKYQRLLHKKDLLEPQTFKLQEATKAA